MANYMVEIKGASSLPSINQQVRGEEAGASEFVQSQVALLGGSLTNVVTFKELPPGTLPPTATIITQGSIPPANTTLRWSGTMIVSGSAQAIELHR